MLSLVDRVDPAAKADPPFCILENAKKRDSVRSLVPDARLYEPVADEGVQRLVRAVGVDLHAQSDALRRRWLRDEFADRAVEGEQVELALCVLGEARQLGELVLRV